MCCLEPSEQKKLGRNVKNFDNNVWNDVRDDLLLEILKEKFSQNFECKSYLQNTGDKRLIEATFIH